MFPSRWLGADAGILKGLPGRAVLGGKIWWSCALGCVGLDAMHLVAQPSFPPDPFLWGDDSLAGWRCCRHRHESGLQKGELHGLPWHVHTHCGLLLRPAQGPLLLSGFWTLQSSHTESVSWSLTKQ